MVACRRLFEALSRVPFGGSRWAQGLGATRRSPLIFLPGHLSAEQKDTLDSVRVSLAGLHLSQIAFGALGVLFITSEYSTGMIGATLAAVPRRRLMLGTKAFVFAATALIVGTLGCLAAYFVFQVSLSSDTLRTTIGDLGCFGRSSEAAST